jgi:hypothetical protein
MAGFPILLFFVVLTFKNLTAAKSSGSGELAGELVSPPAAS